MYLDRKLKNLSNRISVVLNDLERDISWIFNDRKTMTAQFEQLLNEHTWCFIVGCNNSGTSILQKMFEKHDQVSIMQREGQMYTKVLKRSKKRGYERVWTEYMDELQVRDNRQVNSITRLVYDWSRALSKPIRPMIVEKTPANVLRMEWLKAAFPNSRFIGLVRNGYAVCEGINRKGEKNFDRASRHWNAVNKILLEKSKKNNFEYMELKYEDLCDKPEETAMRLSSFLGIEAQPLLDSMSSDFHFTTVQGYGAMQLSNMNYKSIARLGPSDIETIRNNAAEMLDYFDYVPE